MKETRHHTIFTIGHSTHPMEEFLAMIQHFSIQTIADIRSLPGSRKFPQFNKENLQRVLLENGIEYLHLKDLGGRRKVKKDSHNNRWRNDSFKGYADYMETDEFKAAAHQLEIVASQKTTAYMCAEAVWWRCHRSMLSDYLKTKGWQVLHIINKNKAEPHQYTSPARIINGELCYSDNC